MNQGRFGIGFLLALLTMPAFALAEDLLKVGVSIPLSGAFSEYGVAVRNGIELALSEHPRISDTIRFLFEDDGYEPKRTIAAVNKLVDADGAGLAFVWGNEPALGVAPVAERRKIPCVVVAQHPAAGAGYQYVIRFINPAADYGRAMAEYLQANRFHEIVMLKTEISFFNILLEELEQHLSSGQRVTVLDSFLPNQLDFRAAIGRLKNSSFDILGVYLIAPQVIQFYRQAAELQFRPRTFGSTPLESTTVINQAAGLVDGVVYAHIKVRDDFRERYLSKFGNDHEVAYAANAYQFALILGQLFNSARTWSSPEEVVRQIKSVPAGEGPNGRYQVRSSEKLGTYFEFEMAVRRVEAGRIISVQ